MRNFLTRSLAAVAVVGAMFGASTASAVPFDFAAYADGPAGEGKWADQVGPGGWTQGGITVFASGTGNSLSDAYLDRGNAGLGVCSLSSCAGNSDDNAGYAGDNHHNPVETLILEFSTTVSMVDFLLRDRGHAVWNAGDMLNINGNLFTLGLDNIADWGSNSIWTFARLDSRSLGKDFYLSAVTVSPIPLPAGIWLMGTALAGLAGMSRRRRRKAA
jgi:hypothetical protein